MVHCFVSRGFSWRTFRTLTIEGIKRSVHDKLEFHGLLIRSWRHFTAREGDWRRDSFHASQNERSEEGGANLS